MRRPKDIVRALRSLPKTLDETYKRMLSGIDQDLQEEAHTLLKWLSYSKRPLTHREVAETLTVNLNQQGAIDIGNRPQVEDIMALLTGLIEVKYETIEFHNETTAAGSIVSDEILEEVNEGYIQLAHFSIKEYLESSRSAPMTFHLNPRRDEDFMFNCCLVYLMSYVKTPEKSMDVRDFDDFPLLGYATSTWFEHYVDTGDVQRAVSFLRSREACETWLRLYNMAISLDLFQFADASAKYETLSESLFISSYLGLSAVADSLIKLGADVNDCRDRESWPGRALQAACNYGHESIAKMLIEAGAVLHYQCLRDACQQGHENIVRMLIDANMNVGEIDSDVRGGKTQTALQTAASYGHASIASLLIEAGANVNAQEGQYDTALQAACRLCHMDAVKQLIEAGADVNLQGGYWNTALMAAVAHHDDSEDAVEIVMTLIKNGADIHARGGKYHTVLQTAVAAWVKHDSSVKEEIFKLLIKAGGDVNTQGGFYCTVLQAASCNGSKEIVRMLIEDHGVDVNVQGGYWGSALFAARVIASFHLAHSDAKEIVNMLEDAGATDTRVPDHNYSV